MLPACEPARAFCVRWLLPAFRWLDRREVALWHYGDGKPVARASANFCLDRGFTHAIAWTNRIALGQVERRRFEREKEGPLCQQGPSGWYRSLDFWR